MNGQASPAVQPARRGKHAMLWLIAGIFVAYLATNGVMLFVAFRTPPSLVSKTYYEDSRTYEKVLDAEDASLAAGWQVEATPDAADEVVVRIRDRQGRPASGFSGDVSAYRPNDPGLDQPLAWTEEAGTPGAYRARFSRPRAGQWQIKLALRRGGERLTQDLRIVTP